MCSSIKLMLWRYSHIFCLFFLLLLLIYPSLTFLCDIFLLMSALLAVTLVCHYCFPIVCFALYIFALSTKLRFSEILYSDAYMIQSTRSSIASHTSRNDFHSNTKLECMLLILCQYITMLCNVIIFWWSVWLCGGKYWMYWCNKL